MKILITGSGGFLGGWLIEYMLEMTKYDLIASTSQKNRLQKKWVGYEKRLSVISNMELKDIEWNTIGILLNCAFPRDNDGIKMAEGLKFISNLLLMAVTGGVEAVINISSQSVYGQSRIIPATEETELNLENNYVAGKYAVELLTNAICKKIPHTNLRLASLVGPGFDQRIVNKLIFQAVKGNDLCIFGGNQKLGYLDIRDAVSGLLAIIKSNSDMWKEVYNLGSDKSYTLEEIAKHICSLNPKYCKKIIDYHIIPKEIKQNSELDCRLFYETFEWRPVFGLDSILCNIYQYI